MAKKITLEEYQRQNENKNKLNKEKNKLLLPLEIMIVLFGCSLISIVLLLIYNKPKCIEEEKEISKLKNTLSTEKSLKEDYKDNLESLTGDYDVGYIQEKLDFFDDSIVFVIDGFGNYYYTYDCMIQRVGNNKYTYRAFNENAAIAEGYKAGVC